MNAIARVLLIMVFYLYEKKISILADIFTVNLEMHKLKLVLKIRLVSNYMMSVGNFFDLQKLLGHTEIEMTMCEQTES